MSRVISGHYLDGDSAAVQEAQLLIDSGEELAVLGIAAPFRARLASVRFIAPVGNIPYRVKFENGAVFETRDRAAVSAALRAVGYRESSKIVQWAENHWPVALGSLLVTIILTVGFVQYGIPALADITARNIPKSVDQLLGQQSLELLDDLMFESSNLSAAQQATLIARFRAMTDNIGDGQHYRLQFRYSVLLGPNAVALPSGIIVMTDELVELAEHEDELLAVLAHEVGHVKERHALRQLLRSAGISALALAVLGDASSMASLVGFVPALLEAQHSREFEREADAFAKSWLKSHGIPSSRFDQILCRISHAADVLADEDYSYFSSHPPLAERAQCKP
jgi:Zn-dependent protease with chaperone function